MAFANTIATTDSLNVQTDPYVYNGAGVGVGDIDNDGLPDIVFAGNMVSTRLYLNRGDMRFEDITASAGLTTHRWVTGVTLVDVNNDGYLDIYLSVSGPPWSTPDERRNLLFINNGNRTFTEQAARYHVDDSGFTTHAVFLDYDRDGDLDLFLLGNSPEDFARGAAMRNPAAISTRSPASYDRLYRNNGDGTFTDVTKQAIVNEVGYGLGVVVTDLNRDGWPDIYISNDLAPDDVLYVNNHDGTFTNKASVWLKHTSFAGMGMDIADFNNDGWPDILQTDMMPEDLAARKLMSGQVSYGDVMQWRRRGLHAAYTLNTLQLNNGLIAPGDVSFSEIARMAGVAYTHWSWSAVFGDYDNDGFKDILITNGYPKAVTDFDFQTTMFAIHREGQKVTPRGLQILRDLRPYSVPNYIFRNNGDLTFSNETQAWGLNQPGFSYGAAYADLNNDGRLDLVINNIDAPASIYENVQANDGAHHYLTIELRGESPNRRGIGATLTLFTGGQQQFVYQTPYHGFMSTMDDRAHFGLGSATKVDSLAIVWPDGRSQILRDVSVDEVLILRETAAARAMPSRPVATSQYLSFEKLDPPLAPAYTQPPKPYVDYSVQQLLPDQLSMQGPPLAVADVNGDGLEDVFIGGGAGVPGTLYLQRPGGRFLEGSEGEPWGAEAGYEDWGAAFFDANGDGLPDLYVASGGYQLAPVSALLQDRLYINQGGGKFARDAAALPPMLTSTAAIVVGDFTGDGKPDLFVGGRLVPRNYPYPARSYLLRNDGRGHFTDVTQDVCPDLVTPGGMITSAVWIDFDGDGRLDLVTAGLWMPLQFFKNDGTHLRKVTAALGLSATRGWWYSLAAGDFNHDGHVDLVAGNLGLNTFTTGPGHRFGVYAADFTGNRTTDIVLTQEVNGREYPLLGAAMLGRAMYPIPIKFPTYLSFANATVQQIFGAPQLQHALHYQTDTFASLYLQNNGRGRFTATPLPNLAQIAPIRGIIADDVDGDGNLDLIVAGNLYDLEPNTPRADAGDGLWLRGDGQGHFSPVLPSESGFFAPLNVTGLALMQTPAGKAVLVSNSGDSLQAFVIRRR